MNFRSGITNTGGSQHKTVRFNFLQRERFRSFFRKSFHFHIPYNKKSLLGECRKGLVCVGVWAHGKKRSAYAIVWEMLPFGFIFMEWKSVFEGMNPMGKKESKHTHICRSRENGLYELNNLSRKRYIYTHMCMLYINTRSIFFFVLMCWGSHGKKIHKYLASLMYI